METDVLIIGCGIGGATAALELARDRERRVTMLSRAARPEDSNSSWAQGGIVGKGENDSAELIAGDILRAGGDLANPAAVRLIAEEGPRRVRDILIDRAGVQFDRGSSGDPEYGLEGAHSRRRILHVGDLTGQAIMEALLRQVAATPNIELLTGHTAVDLVTFPHHARDPLAIYRPPICHGAYALVHATGKVQPILAAHTILATGGLGQIFLNTSNAPGARGDGLAMAYRAGARVVNAEYIQFHPTALHMPGHTKILISEAVRGEGGVLLTPDGRPFLEKYSPEKELAARDIVARAIYTEMVENDYPFLHLDIASKQSAAFIRERFPGIHAQCMERGIDITTQPIPVVPAAHYFCGGVLVDLDGATTLPRLYAVGEVSCTGVHGANRLASTSLLEGLVWGARAAARIRSAPADDRPVTTDAIPPWEVAGLTTEVDPALIQGDNQNIRNLMWHYVGLVRNAYRMTRALRELRSLWLNIEEFYKKAFLTDDLIGLRNTVLNALIVTRAALENPVSRGCHFRDDAHEAPGAAPPNGTNRLEPAG